MKGNNCKGLPKVDVHFDRREYQAKDSRGNRYYVHAGFNTKTISLSELRKMICYDLNCMFVEEYGISYSQLLEARIVCCYDEYEYTENIVTTNTRYWCIILKDRFKQRVRLDGELIYRI